MGTDPNPPGGRGRMQAQRTPGGLPVAGGQRNRARRFRGLRNFPAPELIVATGSNSGSA